MRELITVLPDDGVNVLSGPQVARTVGRISTAPSGKEFLLLMLVLFLTTSATYTQVVGTWIFANPQQQEQALFIVSQLHCPQCQNRNSLESNVPVAANMRRQVYSMVAEGKSEAEITTWMTEHYSDFVCYDPSLNERTLLLWALPRLLLLLVGAVVWRMRGYQHTEAGKQRTSPSRCYAQCL